MRASWKMEDDEWLSYGVLGLKCVRLGSNLIFGTWPVYMNRVKFAYLTFIYT